MISATAAFPGCVVYQRDLTRLRMMQAQLRFPLEVVHEKPIYKQFAPRTDVQRRVGTARAADGKPEGTGGDSE